MKWPIPREAKFSPTFHEVSPEIVPPHSFCQIRLPIRWASAEEISTAACSEAVASIMRVRGTATWRLDASTFFSSVPDFIPRRFWRFHSMKHLVIGITLATLAAPAFAQNPPALKDSKDKVSYSIGLDIGATFKKQKMELNGDALAAGVKDALSGTKPLLNDDEVRQVMMTFSKEMTEKTAMANKEAADKNTAEGEKFLT